MTHAAKTLPPKPPYKGFPLWWHPRGGWSKKIVGKVYYFGKDPLAAEAEYNAVRDDLNAGREPRAWTADGVTVADLFNDFLTSKRDKADDGDLSESTFRDYFDILSMATKSLGRNTVVANLRPADFRKLRRTLGQGKTAVTLKKRIICTRSPFRFGIRNGMIAEQPSFGDEFNVPEEKKIANERFENDLEHGVRSFEAEELQSILDGANPVLTAMVLLGINCGFTQTDIAGLPIVAVNLENGVIDWFRKKKGTVRRCTLWPETVVALRNVELIRKPEPRPEAAGLFFVTSHGFPYVRYQLKASSEEVKYKSRVDAVHTMFQRRTKSLGFDRHGRGFGSLRHTFRTVADGVLDETAINILMGHKANDIGRKYYLRAKSGFFDDRLKAVTCHVRNWLYRF